MSGMVKQLGIGLEFRTVLFHHGIGGSPIRTGLQYGGNNETARKYNLCVVGDCMQFYGARFQGKVMSCCL